MKHILQIFTVFSVVYNILGNPLVEPDEEICTGKIENLNNFSSMCQQTIDQSAMVGILNDIMHYNVTGPQLKTYIEQNCDSVNEATQCLLEAKNIAYDQRCEKFTKYSKGIYSFDIVLMKTLYLCGNNNGQHFEDLVPNNGLKCMYGNENYIKCFINKQQVIDADPNTLATETCVNTQSHLECLDNLTDCPNDKPANAMKTVVLLYKEIFNC